MCDRCRARALFAAISHDLHELEFRTHHADELTGAIHETGGILVSLPE
jgi:hypothetical protein